MKVAAAIPAWNEQKAISSVVLLTREHVDKVLVVNDGSGDRTGLLARTAGAEVISHGKSKGKGGGIATALRWARDSDVDILVLLDGDGQHDPDAIPTLIEPILKEEADITIGSRWHHEKGLKEMPFHRVMGNWVLSTATSMSLSKQIKDSQSGYRAFHKRTFKSFSGAMENGFAVESEMITLADKDGYRWKEVGIPASYDDLDTSTHGSFYHGLSVLGKAMRLMRMYQPARFFLALSLLPMIMAGTVVVYSRITYPDVNLLPMGSMYIVVSMVILMNYFWFCGIMLSGVNRTADRMLKMMMRSGEKNG